MRRFWPCALASLVGLTLVGCDPAEPGDSGQDGPSGGKADDVAPSAVAPVPLYNPLGIRPLGYVDKMHASLLATELDEDGWRDDRISVMERLDTADQAFLMMALAGMEYYPVAQPGEEDLDAILRSVVEFGNPDGDTTQPPTGLSLVASVKKSTLGFRADVVRVDDRPHYIVAVRGTQVKQPSFVQTFGNVIADLSAVGIRVDPALQASFDLDDLQDLRELKDALQHDEFSSNQRVVHAGIFLSASIVQEALHETLVNEIDLEFPDERPCVWITGHSLGGGMAPLIAYRLSKSSAFNTRARLCGVYAYGAPRVANRAFVREYNRTRISADDSLDLGSVTFRFALEDDPIPHVPPNIPFNDTGEVTELVAEVLMELARTYGQDIVDIEALAAAANGRLDQLGEEDTLVAETIFGAGSLIREVYRIMEEAGAVEAIEGAAHQAAKQQVMKLVARFQSVQHLGHTRFIDRDETGHYQMANADPGFQHHLKWMLSFVDNLRNASCLDRQAKTNTAVKQHLLNSLGYHRTPFYAAVLLMHTEHAGGDGSFRYHTGTVDDRLIDGITFYNIENFERRLEERYDEARQTYFGCPP